MADQTFGEGPDTLTLYFHQDAAGDEPARVNFGVLPNGEFVGNAGEYVAVTATGAEAPDVFTIRGDFPADSAFYFSFLNDFYAGEGQDRNVYLSRAEINGVEIEGVATAAFTTGDYGGYWFGGDAAAPAPEPEPEPPAPEPVPGVEVRGTGGADELYGGEGDDTILGLAGDDVLVGKGGADVLRGAGGADVFTGGPGDDTIATGAGRDVVIVGRGDGDDVVIDFSDHADSIWLGSGLTAADVAVADAERDGAEGALLTASGTSVWLPGVAADSLGFVTIIA